MILFDFGDPEAATAWQAIDDRVMGGVSRSRLRATDGHAVFEGTVSDRNNGGFASVRAPVATSGADELQHLQIEQRGASSLYYVNLRTDLASDAISYRGEFSATEGWATLELPLADFAATFRGRSVRDAPPLEPDAIRQVGLMIAERQLGAFTLQVRRIALL